MSRRDGKMYFAMRLSKTVKTNTGALIDCDAGDYAGVIQVFWTKTAARKVYGRNVDLKEIELTDAKAGKP